MGDGGKGSKPRPFSVDKETFDQNWYRIFGKKDADVIPQTGLQRVNKEGILEEYRDGYWTPIVNRQ